MQTRLWQWVLLGWVATWLSVAEAEDIFFQVPWRELKLVDAESAQKLLERAQKTNFLRTGWKEVVLDGEGEAFFCLPPTDAKFLSRDPMFDDFRIVGRMNGKRATLTGHMVVLDSIENRHGVVKFSVPMSALTFDAKLDFHRAREERYLRLAQKSIPGAAWFRHQANISRQALRDLGAQGSSEFERQPASNFLQRADDVGLFSGTRAVSENLQLDRVFAVGRNGPIEKPEVRLDQITGITIKEINWQPLLVEPKPALDPLAAYIPADQYAVFFPSFLAAMDVIQEARQQGHAILMRLNPPTENPQLIERYERQMGLSLSALGRIVGPKLVSSVAVTGGDPNFETGTDLAVLFETSQPAVLSQLLHTKMLLDAATNAEAKLIEGSIEGLTYRGVRSSNRRVCGYVVEFENVVVVTNSPAQIERLARVRAEQSAAIKSLPEYHFFRQRYVLKDPSESALLFVSDATIRRWCGPHWRIAQNRRMRDAAVLWDLQAEHLDGVISSKTAKLGPLTPKWGFTQPSDVFLTATGIESPQLGRPDFLTPISEMSFDKVTQSERVAYEGWRAGYQRNWTMTFDPIALRIGVDQARLTADLTIMPLILNSQYRWPVSLVAGAKLTSETRATHDALLQFDLALNPKSELMQWANGFLKAYLADKLTPTVARESFDPLGWVGDWVRLYADKDPYWLELAQLTATERLEKLRIDGYALPVAMEISVRDSLKLTIFLTVLRTYLEQMNPGQIQWSNGAHRDITYVKLNHRTKTNEPGAQIFSVSLGDVFLITPNEGVMHRAIDRHLDQKSDQSKKEPQPKQDPLLGESMAISMGPLAPALSAWFNNNADFLGEQQQASWNNLAILNEWKRRYPERDPLEVHRRTWSSELLCPGGGQYVWNDAWQTMESTVFGHPASAKRPAKVAVPQPFFKHLNAGVTFELDGLRARMEVQRSER